MKCRHAKTNGSVYPRQLNFLTSFLILMLCLYCAGCVGLTNAGSKTGTQSTGTAPVISISSPAAGATLSGTVLVSTSVSTGTVTVQFKVDGANSGSAVNSAPFELSLDTTKLQDGSHSLTAVASDSSGQTGTSAAVAFTVKNTSAPSISIASPAAGATISGSVAVATTVSANTTKVQFKVDGADEGAVDTGAPFTLALNTAILSNGSHTLTAVAGDAAGQTATSASVKVTVNNSSAPTISITSPTAGQTISGTVAILTSVSSNTKNVQFKVDGANSGAAISAAPFSLSLNTTSLTNGTHSLSAVTTNAAGQSATSAGVSVIVNNTSAPSVSITSPGSGATISGTTTILTSVSANTTNVQFRVDGTNSGAADVTAPFSLSLNTTTLSNGTHSLSAVASNAAGQTTTSAAVSVTVSNTSAPTISITSPASGATISGTTTVSTSVSANTTKVQFRVDGANSGAAITAAPFSLALNTTALSNGTHSLSAVASNAAGQTATSAAISVTVSNTSAPTISITSPASGATISGTTTVSTSVSANTTKVQFRVDGANSGAAITAAPFSLALNTTALSNGTHSLSVVASNAAGQTATSAAISVTVSNTSAPTISISSPASGATVSGTITVSTSVSANTTKVQFLVDGANSGAAVTAAPFSLSLNTTALANGTHTLSAVASNAAAQTASSGSVSITVSNGGTGGGGGGGTLTPSGPVTISGKSGVTIQNLHITNPSGDCVTITNGTNINIQQSEIGPCAGNAIVITGGNTISVSDNYIHPEGQLSGCCDVTDGIFATGTSNLAIQGNVIAFGESNIEAQNQTNLSIIGNFFLNPRGGANSRGQNVQVWSNSTTVLVQNNYALSSTDTTTYAFAEVQEDSINFGSNVTGVTAQGNYVTGGHSNSGCGIIADTSTLTEQFRNNTLLNTGQCGIGITDGTNVVVDGNKILNTTPVAGGGNTAIYVWKVNASDPTCGPVQVSNNIASGVDTSGNANSFWNGGGCEPVTLTNNTFDAAALAALSPAAQKIPPPLIPPQPKLCVIASPWTNNTTVPPCGGSSTPVTNTPPTISITSPASGATVSGSVSVTTSVSSNTTSVQFKVDGANTGAAITTAPFTLALNTASLANGSHSLTAVASNSAAQTTASGAIAIIVNNPKLAITTTSFTSGTIQVSYSATLQASGGTAPYTWSILTGQLPGGLTLSATTGVISGTPTAAGSFSFTVQAKDSTAATTSAGFSLTIATAAPPPVSTAPFGNVYLVALENTNYADVIGSSSMPYLNGLANQYGLATQYYADTHPSIGNYFMWTTGQIITNDDSKVPQTFPISSDNVVREVLAAGKTWKQYAESIPSVGYLGDDSTCCGGQYYAHHAPLPYLADAQTATQLSNIVPFTQFATDLNASALPNYAFITPNGCNDAHDCGLNVADNWLKSNIDPLIKSAQFQKDGLLVIAFDESGSDNTNGGGRVVAVIISPFSKPGFKSTTLYQEESVLRLMLEGLGIKVLPGAAATAPKMWEFFTFTPPS